MVKVTGLNQDGYFIGNPIIVGFEDTSSPLFYIDFILTNLENNQISAKFRAYANASGYIEFNLSPMLKSIFRLPKIVATGSTVEIDSRDEIRIEIEMTYKDENTGNYTIQKTFTRAFRYGNLTNQTPVKNAIQKTTAVLPMWKEFNIYSYFLHGDLTISAGFNPDDFELQTMKNNEGIYLRFLNSLGVLSYWYFETFEKTKKNKSYGSIRNGADFINLGSDFEENTKVFSKVKKEFLPIITDLINSTYVERLESRGMVGENWQQVSLLDNSISDKSQDKVSRVAITFADVLTVNSSLLWN